MNEKINTNVNTEQTATTPTPEASGGQGEKLFTQADLDRIIGDRLARAKRDTDNDKREAALRERENRLTCREFLSDGKFPAELADILPTVDVEAFKTNVGKLAGLFRSMKDTGPTITVDLGGPLTSSPAKSTSSISDAFKPPKI